MLSRFANNKEKILLYLDTRELPLERIAEIRAAKDQGYKIFMATSTPTAYKGMDIDYLLAVNVADHKIALPTILDYINQHNLTVSGILSWKDREVVLASYLGEALNLPHTPTKSVDNVRNKYLTRQCLSSCGNVNPRYALIKDESSLIESLNQVGTPAILKQAGNSGSRGMRIIDNVEQALDIYHDLLSFNKNQPGDMYHYYEDIILLEELVTGSEHSIAGVVTDDEIITFAIADKKVDRSLPIQYQNVVPSMLNNDVQLNIVEQVKIAVKATGIKWCGFHVDFMMTEEGMKILEIGGRLGGEMINSHLIPLAIPGLNPYQAYIDIVQGKQPLTETDYVTKESMRAASRVIMPKARGKITAIEGVQHVRKDSRCREFMQTYGIGDEMVYPDIRFKGYEIGYFIIQCALSDDIEQVISELNDKIVISINEAK